MPKTRNTRVSSVISCVICKAESIVKSSEFFIVLLYVVKRNKVPSDPGATYSMRRYKTQSCSKVHTFSIKRQKQNYINYTALCRHLRGFFCSFVLFQKTTSCWHVGFFIDSCLGWDSSPVSTRLLLVYFLILYKHSSFCTLLHSRMVYLSQ